jgi:DNA-binding MarR family transcriptional regulator
MLGGEHMDAATDEPIDFEERQAAACLHGALRVLLSMRRSVTLQQVRTFLHVAFEEGLTVSGLAAKVGVPTNTVSKYVRDLGTTNRRQEPGLGLITIIQRPHGDRREWHVILTERGAAVVRQMKAAFEHGKAANGRPR